MIYNHDLQLRNRNSVENQTNQANTANQSNATAIWYLIKVNINCKNMILNTYATQFDDCTKDVLKELYVQKEEMSDMDEESAEVEDK